MVLTLIPLLLLFMSHLLLQTKVHLQLHEENALAHVEGLLQVIKRVVDVVLDGALLIGQLLQDLRQHQQGGVDVWQPGSERERERGGGERERERIKIIKNHTVLCDLK